MSKLDKEQAKRQIDARAADEAENAVDDDEAGCWSRSVGRSVRSLWLEERGAQAVVGKAEGGREGGEIRIRSRSFEDDQKSCQNRSWNWGKRMNGWKLTIAKEEIKKFFWIQVMEANGDFLDFFYRRRLIQIHLNARFTHLKTRQ